MTEPMLPSDNPYAAPQAELHALPSARLVNGDARRNYLAQGFMAGLQLGGMGSILTVLIYVLTWNDRSSLLALVLIPFCIMVGCIFVGTMIGGIVHLAAIIVGLPTEIMLPSLPFPLSEPSEFTASQEFDKTGIHPPTMF